VQPLGKARKVFALWFSKEVASRLLSMLFGKSKDKLGKRVILALYRTGGCSALKGKKKNFIGLQSLKTLAI